VDVAAINLENGTVGLGLRGSFRSGVRVAVGGVGLDYECGGNQKDEQHQTAESSGAPASDFEEPLGQDLGLPLCLIQNSELNCRTERSTPHKVSLVGRGGHTHRESRAP